MGWFGTDVHNVVVSQATNGKATAQIEIPVPMWEIILIAIIVFFLLWAIMKFCVTGFRKYINREFQRARAMEEIA
jgi:hypothetical protein